MTAPTLRPPAGGVNATAAAIAEGPGRTAPELAKALGVDRRTVDRHGTRLEAEGRAHRVRRPNGLPSGRVEWHPGPEPAATALGRGPAHPGERIRLLRERRGLSQVEAARRAGTKPSRLHAAETGRSSPLWASVVRWAHAWGCTPADLAATILLPADDA